MQVACAWAGPECQVQHRAAQRQQYPLAPCMRQALALIGEFNDWQPKDEHWAIKNDFGVWQLFLPDNPDGTSAIPHRCACVWEGL